MDSQVNKCIIDKKSYRFIRDLFWKTIDINEKSTGPKTTQCGTPESTVAEGEDLP